VRGPNKDFSILINSQNIRTGTLTLFPSPAKVRERGKLRTAQESMLALACMTLFRKARFCDSFFIVRAAGRFFVIYMA
jgi:hypothetical protein